MMMAAGCVVLLEQGELLAVKCTIVLFSVCK